MKVGQWWVPRSSGFGIAGAVEIVEARGGRVRWRSRDGGRTACTDREAFRKAYRWAPEIPTRAEAAEKLRETRRYVRDHPEHVRAEFHPTRGFIGFAVLPMLPERLSSNLLVGLKFIQVQPSVLEGYMEAAAFELGLREIPA